MKENLPPTPSDADAAADPLLAALRERLGDYGAAPPPGAWAGIRQRLPAAPRPWWRRPRRLLPLLALLLGLVTALVVLQRWPAGTSHSAGPAKTAPSAAQATRQAVSAGLSAGLARQAATAHSSTRTRPATAELPGAGPTQRSQPATAQPLASADSGLTTRPPSKAGGTASSLGVGPAQANASFEAAPSTIPTSKILTTSPEHGHRPTEPLLVSRPRTRRPATAAREARWPSATFSAHPSAGQALASKRTLASRAGLPLARRHYRPGASQRQHPRPASSADSLARAVAPAEPAAGLAAGARRYSRPEHRPAPPSARPPMPDEQGQLAVAELARHLVGLLAAPALPLPAPLASRPDSTRPARPVRRWALLAVAGPTLSYRTSGPTPGAPTARPDFAHLERPALGFGAQVQVRRVLSGRWTLAAGLGYHEYATRLALQLPDSGGRRLRQRDTYQLLTLPVQLGYALGVPRGRLAKALLLGAEAGWYRGGRSTEGADCGCQQATYTAAASPYRPWSLALSLGLDLRYRVGSPASRWQWVVQPTGRYVLTPFVGGPAAAGFAPRQPFSLGLLTGFSWDVR